MTAMDAGFLLIAALAWLLAARREPRTDGAVLALFAAAALATSYPNEGGLLRFSVARVDLRDLTFLAAVGLALAARGRAAARPLPPAAVFYGAVVVSLAFAWIDGDVALVRGLRDLRPLLFLGFAVVVPAVLTTAGALRLFVRALGWYAGLVLGLLPLQMALAPKGVVFLGGFPAAPGLLFLGGWSWASITLGNAFVFVGLYRLLAGAPLPAGRAATALLVGAGACLVFVGLARMNIVSLAAATVVALLLLPWRAKGRVLAGLVVAVAVFAGALAAGTVLAPRLAGRAEDRVRMLVGTLLDPQEYRSTAVTGVRTSIGRRLMEDDVALRVFTRRPLLGAGLGYKYWQGVEVYTPWGEPVSLRNIQVRGGTYIHNGWLWMLSKTGLLGAVAFAAFVAPPFLGALGRLRRLPDVADQALVFGLGFRGVGLLVDGFGHPYFFTVATTAGLGVTAGVIVATFALARQGARRERTAEPLHRDPLLRRSAWHHLPVPALAAGAPAPAPDGGR
jgi:hypothetical protein